MSQAASAHRGSNKAEDPPGLAPLNHHPAFVYIDSNDKLNRPSESFTDRPASITAPKGRPERQNRRQSMKTNPWRIGAALVLVAAGIGLLVLIVNNNNAGRRDFIQYWAAGRQLIHGANPYDGAALLRIERAEGYDRTEAIVSPSPPLVFLLALPLGLVSPNSGLILWLVLLLASLVASIRMLWTLQGRPANRLHLLAYCFPPIMECLMAGQISLFILLGIVLFLYFQNSRPFLAGAALLPCALKPHLFLPFAIVLLLWAFYRKAYPVLAGFIAALVVGCALTLLFDIHVWSQYAAMMRASKLMELPVPTLSVVFRVLIDRTATWLQFLPEAAGSAWSLWYFWTRRDRWDWMDQGLLLLLVSATCAPYAWFSDEAVLLPAVLVGIYCADDTGRSLLPFGLIAGVAIVEVLAEIPMTSMYYLWTTPAWLGWYLYATRNNGMRAAAARSVPVEIAKPY